MEHNLYLYTKLLPKETWLKIYETLCLVCEKNKLQEPDMDKETLSISAYYFTFFCMDLNERIDTEYYQFLEEEVGIKTNYYIYIQFITRRVKEGMSIFFQVVRELLKLFPNDILFMEIEGTIVFKKLNGKFLVNNHFDKYQKELYAKEILDVLGVSYIYDDEVNIL